MCWVSQEFQERVRQIVCPDFVIFARTRNRRGPRAAFPSACLAAQTKRWAEMVGEREQVVPVTVEALGLLTFRLKREREINFHVTKTIAT